MGASGSQPRFVTSIYGSKYAAFLAPLLASIVRHHEAGHDSSRGPLGVVLWQDVPAREIAVLAAAYEQFEFVELSFPRGENIMHAIPRKIHAWLAGAKRFADEPVALVDCDTIVHAPIHSVFDGSWDVLFTWKDELFPINTGVMMGRTGAHAAFVFEAMLPRIERMIASDADMRQAVGSSGAADQHALREIIGYCNYDRTFTRRVTAGGHEREIVFRGEPCEKFNQTNCRPLTGDLKIIHYKTGWHPILLEGAEFTKNRPKDACTAMFRHWHEAEEAASDDVVRQITLRGARRVREKFAAIAGSYEERGILHSEMLAVCGVCAELGVEYIIESGRCRGQSTLVLSRFFESTKVRVESVELFRDENAPFAEARLAGFSGTTLHYGDSFALIPKLLSRTGGRRTALLLDGPKGFEAIELARRSFQACPDLVAAFVHDLRRGTPQRDRRDHGGPTPFRWFYTDDDAFVQEFGPLDKECLPAPGAEITMHTWRPHLKGHDAIQSYGPTLGVMLARPARERMMATPIAAPAATSAPAVIDAKSAALQGVSA